ncbi:uncharacterized protein [Coffea arabica]|uniref:Uncharacterized protein LOC113711954 n=1 Tax=Coffea arabica TaxID=13443 RepID=A0A6P6UKE7_COFAR|nr:uncharacterized protein LOC113711954 [Coffea arabica]XP_027091005.1 uncharacterized protein LOC113711954 [Coffea arabica]
MKIAELEVDMGHNPVDDRNPVLPSKRKCRNIKRHGYKNCKSDFLKKGSKSFDEFGAGVDEDSRRFLSSDAIPLLTNDGYNGRGDIIPSLINDESNDNGVNDDDLYEDPHYKIFLDSLRVEGKSFVIEVNEKNGIYEPLKYDAKEGYDDGLDLGNQRKMKAMVEGYVDDDKSNSLSGSKLDSLLVFSSTTKRQRRQFVVEDYTSSEPIHSNPIKNQACLVEEVGNEGTSSSNRKCKTNGQGEKGKSRILKNSRKVTRRGKLEATANVEKKNDHECDEDYQSYKNHLSIDGKNMVLKYENAWPVIYENDELLPNVETNNRTYSVKKERTQLDADAGGPDASVIGDDSCHYVGTPSRHSPFREQVMRTLRKPYDSMEHKKLSQDILARKPIARNLDLRNGREQIYLMNKEGKSYLDHFYDLKRKLQAAKTAHEELNLLRGFFFWLQNLTQEGAFRPWTDASCLAL